MGSVLGHYGRLKLASIILCDPSDGELNYAMSTEPQVFTPLVKFASVIT